MRGYIAVTDPYWFKFQRLKNHKKVVFWRKSSKPVNLVRGDYFFFLIKGKLPRLIKGYGLVKSVGVKKLKAMWKKYKEKNGCSTIRDLERIIGLSREEEVAYYLLENVNYFESAPIASDADIDFAKDIMAGKYLSKEELSFLRLKFGIKVEREEHRKD